MFSTPFVLSFSLFLSLSLLLLFAPRILPPKHVTISPTDEIEDLALFHQATQTSTHNPSIVSHLATTKAKPKIAFLFLTNSDLTFSPLWEKFFNGHVQLFNIYIHLDPSVKITPPGGVFEGRFIKARRTERGSPTLISATRRLLAHALIDDSRNMYFALLSQHCIPLHSFQFMYNYLFSKTHNSALKSFIEILSNEPTLPDRYVARGKHVMLPEVPYEQFRVGSQFFVLNRRHSLVVIKDRRLWRKFKLPCLNLYSCYPEEHYFPTLLDMEDPNGCTHFTLTRVNWTGSTGGHPHTYGPGEVSAELVYKLRESSSSYPFLFARKFSADCLDPLLQISDSVLFRD
ncbi:Glycosyl transferase, family 14 [Dillenia turbinata]|uniref:Glycosyl transferase, family 14 n=1 Tax=Dillenia turbinata TaxID=194707 RepID=A0AAN8ZCV8_9MAGN